MRYSNMVLTAEEYNILWECLSQIKNDLNIFKPEIFYVKPVHSMETREYFEKKQKNIDKNVSIMFELLEQLYKQVNIFQNLNSLQFVLNKVKERVNMEEDNKWYIVCGSDYLSYICDSWEESPNSILIRLTNAKVINYDNNVNNISISEKIHKEIWINSKGINFITKVNINYTTKTIETI